MKSPDIPEDEAARLKTLHSLHILDTAPEERFDRLTRMAKRLFQVPIALVSLVDENRQWFKSRVGLDIGETPRDLSFCGHAILGDDVFVIPDATNDSRFSDNPLVTNEPHIQFYAGCPLRFSDGRKLGTLCILDNKPREFSSEDREVLKDLAATVERELAAVEMATTDDLTGLMNRRGFMLLAENSLNICVRQQLPASLIFLDLDQFKAINDRFGHAEGDDALVAFSSSLKTVCRDTDLYARLGGDEFAILLVDSLRDSAEEIVARLRLSIEDDGSQSDRGYTLSFSSGIVDLNPEKHQSLESLLAAGDSLMYEAKRKK